MQIENFHTLLKNPFEITEEQTTELQTLVEEFPYFQTARMLSLKGIMQHHSPNYNESLRETAAYITDRALLFNYITHENFIKKQEKPVETQPTEIIENNTEIIVEPSVNEVETIEEEISVIEQVEQKKPLEFDRNELHSFNEWLSLTNQSTSTTVHKEDELNKKYQIIDQFIASNRKLSPPKNKKENIDIAQSSITENQSLMTETLARIYVDQKKYDKAIQAFHILSLKYPEKSGYFADQIKLIKNLEKEI